MVIDMLLCFIQFYLHVHVQRDMMLLKMQIEKARGEAELVQVKAQLEQMKGAAAAGRK